MQEHTLKKEYIFEGKGLHTGLNVKMVVKPAEAGTGIRFKRVDLSQENYIEAVSDYVSKTARSTTLSKDNLSVTTIEHILSALTGLGVDNAIIELDKEEVPILDGSAKPYIKAFLQDGIQEQNVERQYLEVKETIELKDEKTGSWIKVEPAESFSYDLTVDFNSKVLGVQTAHYDESIDYAENFGICRTFVFFHEIEFLFANNLIKGGDVDNAIVIVEHQVTQEQVDNIAKHIGKPALAVTDSGYLNNLELRFPNECGRHKMLDLIGDLRLCGGFLKAKITAYKSGHQINTKMARKIREQLNLNKI